jgi:Fuc2NAc and GlcNAc transferase
MLLTTLTLALSAIVSCLLTGWVRRYAIHTQMLDHPNARSSHSTPTPRGGGVAIVVSFTLAVSILWANGLCPPNLAATLLATSLPVALVGFLDDRVSVPARWRFAVHVAAGAGVVACMGGIPPVTFFGVVVNLGWFGNALAVAYLAWMINLYNFMDGIDGLASIEAITVALGGAICCLTAQDAQFVPLLVGLCACVAGFLVWNFPPAKIFMGDAGSGFIGLVLGFFSLWTALEATQIYWCWFILLGVFMVDATTTLVRRVRRGERFNEAHRSHAYQYASRLHGSHKRVSLAVAAINIFWLLPIAALVALRWVDGVAATIVAYIPLVWLAFRYKAGSRSEQER